MQHRHLYNLQKSKKSGEPDRKLLDSVWGEVPETETTAIMGPSGAGKSFKKYIKKFNETSRNVERKILFRQQSLMVVYSSIAIVSLQGKLHY